MQHSTGRPHRGELARLWRGARRGKAPRASPQPKARTRGSDMISLFPKQEDFFTLFNRQAELMRQGTAMLQEMLERFDRLEERSKALKAVEHEADQVTHDVFARLNRTFITPLEREDIHDLAAGLDDVLDAAEAIGTRLVLFKVTRTTPEAAKLRGLLAAAAGP